MKYLLFDVGCIECGEESGVVGVFTAKEVAEKHAEALNKGHGFTGGQHSYEIFELPDDNVMNKEYKEMLAPTIDNQLVIGEEK